MLQEFYDGMVGGGQDLREGIANFANDLIDGDSDAWLEVIKSPFNIIPGNTTTTEETESSAYETGYDLMIILPSIVGKGKAKRKKQIRIKPGKEPKQFPVHSSEKKALEASGQPKTVQPEFHDKPSSRGQRPHYHDIKNPNIHHTWGKAKRKK